MLVRGEYYVPFANAWHEFKELSCDAENEDPTHLPEDQLFLILISEHGGQTLEDTIFSSFEEAKSVMLQVLLIRSVPAAGLMFKSACTLRKCNTMQVVLALAVAESCHEFEHRDLHWGNMYDHRWFGNIALYDVQRPMVACVCRLIQKDDKENSVQHFQLDGVEYLVKSFGNRVCIIDFTLCRITTTEGEVLATRLEEVDWLFTETEVR